MIIIVILQEAICEMNVTDGASKLSFNHLGWVCLPLASIRARKRCVIDSPNGPLRNVLTLFQQSIFKFRYRKLKL